MGFVLWRGAGCAWETESVGRKLWWGFFFGGGGGMLGVLGVLGESGG